MSGNIFLVAFLVIFAVSGTLLAQGLDTEFDYGGLSERSNGDSVRDWLDQLLPSREVRGSKRCGKMRHCWGVCCGGMRCCKKGWSCRYMNNIRIYTCIP